MKKVKTIIIASVCVLALYSCDQRGISERVNDLKNPMTIVIDSCEYLASKAPEGDYGWVMTHKGNCRKCRAFFENKMVLISKQK